MLSRCASRGSQPIPQPHPTPGPPPTEQPGRTPEKPTQRPASSVRSVTVQVPGRPGEPGRVLRLALDDYVEGAVAAEAWVRSGSEPAYAEKVFELQALVARTYALANLGRHKHEGFDLCATTHCQIYRPVPATHPWREVIQQAATRTHAEVILYGGAPIQALFHANCGGATSAAHDIWGGAERPYLTSVPDPICARDPASAWRVSLPHDDLVRALDRDPRTAVGGRLDSIDILDTAPAGRVLLVALTGIRSPVVRGEELRAIIMRTFGARSVQGPRYRIRRDGQSFVFTGTGMGHGAGLCQFGAAARLRGGASPEEVVRYYFPGSTVGRLRDET